ncbi:MAG: PD-(D/E)XK nuclease family protein [Schleiferiaceae bacterium]
MKFLHQVADKLRNDHPDKLSEVLVVTPSKRAELFLKTELTNVLDKPTISPRFMTIEEWAEELTGFSLLSGLPLLAKLYEAHQNLLGEEANSFEEFTKWGQSLLGDFNEVDRYRLIPEQIFYNLRDAKVLERWGLQPDEEPTELMETYLEFWDHILPLYHAFTGLLKKNNTAYQGMAFREMSDQLDGLDNWLRENKIQETYLVGFNALNASEEMVFRHLLKTNSATVLWDMDSYFSDPPHQEAGLFFRRYLEEWSELDSQKLSWISNDWDHKPKTIDAFGVSGSFAQAQKVSEILSELPAEAIEEKRVAVVLADEGLLVPVVDALPSNIESFNITMGLPLKETPLASFVILLVSLLEKREKAQSNSFYYTDLIRLFEQPAINEYTSSKKASAEAFIQKIHSKNWVYTTWEEIFKNLPELKGEALETLLKPNVSMSEWLVAAQEFFQFYAECVRDQKLEREIAYKMFKVFGQLASLIEDHEFLGSFIHLKPFIIQSIGEESLDFVGEPLEGLQILGILETRLLDFDHIIMTSVNEGVLPKGKTPGSLIPFDLKVGFGLPTHTEKDAVYAYHFYRLLKGAEKVTLIYNVAPAEIGTTEPSRFVLQLAREWGGLPHQSFVQRTENTYLPPNTIEEDYAVAKTPPLREAIDVIAHEKGFSPSSLTTFIKNPLTFYKQRILRVSEAEDVEETIGDNTMGSYLHEVLETLYTPFVDSQKPLKAEDIAAMKSQGKDLLYKAFREDFSDRSLASGKNHLIFNVALEMLNTFFAEEKKRIAKNESEGLPTRVLSLENEYTSSLGNPERPILLKGLIDRVDLVGDTVHILDYKTGYVKTTALSLKGTEEIAMAENTKDKAIQLLCYGWLFTETHPNAKVSLGIVAMRMSGEIHPLKIDKATVFTRQDFEPFMDQILEVIECVLDPNQDFVLNPNSPY